MLNLYLNKKKQKMSSLFAHNSKIKNVGLEFESRVATVGAWPANKNARKEETALPLPFSKTLSHFISSPHPRGYLGYGYSL